MKKIILSVALATASLTALAGGSTPVAQSSFSPFYAGVNGGAAIPSGNFAGPMLNTGFNLGGFAGYRFNENMRADLSIDYIRNALSNDYLRTNGLTSGHANQVAVLANAYYDITQVNMAGLVPYVGAGLGWVHASVSGSGFDTVSQNAFGWQLATGVNYNFSPNMGLGLGYRFLATRLGANGNINDEASAQTGYSNLINASLTYHFSM